MRTRAAGSAFSPSPSLNRKLRREEVDVGSASCPLHMGSVLLESKRGGGASFRSRDGPSGHGPTLTGEPGHNVGDLLRRQWLSGDVLAPVRLSQVRPAGDHRGAKRLIA